MAVRWGAGVVVLVVFALLTYLSETAGMMWLAMVTYGCTRDYFTALFFRGPRAASVLMVGPMLGWGWRCLVRLLDDRCTISSGVESVNKSMNGGNDGNPADRPTSTLSAEDSSEEGSGGGNVEKPGGAEGTEAVKKVKDYGSNSSKNTVRGAAPPFEWWVCGCTYNVRPMCTDLAAVTIATVAACSAHWLFCGQDEQAQCWSFFY
jgi:hypothetical protein